MYYLSHKGFTLSLANKLESAINDVLLKYNRILIASIELEAFKQEMLEAFTECHRLNPRCKPIKLEWWHPSERMSKEHAPDGDISLSSGGNGKFSFTIYKSHSCFFPKQKN